MSLFGGGSSISTSENKLSGMQIQNSSQGVPIAIVYGTARLTGNLIWYGDFTAIAHTQTQSGGKGLSGTSVSNTTYTYTAGIALGLCEGSILGYGTVWASKDITDTATLGLTEFSGSYAQNAWSYLNTYHPGDAYAYRGTAYVASGAFDLGGSGSLPNLSFEVYGLLCTRQAPDVTPAAVALDILGNANYGAAMNQAQIGNLGEFNSYCQAAGIRISPVYGEQKAAADIVAELCLIGNSAVVWSEGVLKFIPYADAPIVAPIALNGAMPSLALATARGNVSITGAAKSLALADAMPALAVATDQGSVSTTTATPPTMPLDSAMPAVSVAAT